MLLGMDILKRLNLQMYLNRKLLSAKLDSNQPDICAVSPPELTKHEIRLKESTPLKQRYRPKNPAMQAIIDTEVEKMLQEGVIQPSNSAWSAPIVMTKRKNEKYRFCIDFRRLNKLSEKGIYPLPQVNATLDKLKGAKYITTIDLKNGYCQVALTEESRPLTAFTVPRKGLFEFKVMPFGLHVAPATFQRLLDHIITAEMASHVLAYLDDIIVAHLKYSITYKPFS